MAKKYLAARQAGSGSLQNSVRKPAVRRRTSAKGFRNAGPAGVYGGRGKVAGVVMVLVTIVVLGGAPA